jgi:AcrR family transcriptional regulator
MAEQQQPPDARTRILEAAWRLIGDRQDAAVSLLEIAQEAGVSRQTVYVNFGSRAGLLLAMVDHRDASSAELARLKRTRQDMPPDEALEPFIRAWFAYVPVVFKVSRALSSAATADEAAHAAWQSRMALVQGGLLALMRGLKAQGRLATDWTPEAAADWSYHQMHIDTWQHLVVERYWKPADVVQRTVTSLKQALLLPPAESPRPGTRARKSRAPRPAG